MVPWVAGCVGEGLLRDCILRAQVVVEGGPIWAIETVLQVLGPGAILVAWPEVDPGLPLCFNPSHVAQLSIDLCQGAGREEAGPAPGDKPGVLSPGSLPRGQGAGWDCCPLGVPSSAVLPTSPHRLPYFVPNNRDRRQRHSSGRPTPL